MLGTVLGGEGEGGTDGARALGGALGGGGRVGGLTRPHARLRRLVLLVGERGRAHARRAPRLGLAALLAPLALCARLGGQPVVAVARAVGTQAPQVPARRERGLGDEPAEEHREADGDEPLGGSHAVGAHAQREERREEPATDEEEAEEQRGQPHPHLPPPLAPQLLPGERLLASLLDERGRGRRRLRRVRRGALHLGPARSGAQGVRLGRRGGGRVRLEAKLREVGVELEILGHRLGAHGLRGDLDDDPLHARLHGMQPLRELLGHVLGGALGRVDGGRRGGQHGEPAEGLSPPEGRLAEGGVVPERAALAEGAAAALERATTAALERAATAAALERAAALAEGARRVGSGAAVAGLELLLQLTPLGRELAQLHA